VGRDGRERGTEKGRGKRGRRAGIAREGRGEMGGGNLPSSSFALREKETVLDKQEF